MATKDTNESLLGGDRVRYRPPVRESNSTAGQARADLLTAAGGMALTVDKMRANAQLESELETARAGAAATMEIQSIFDKGGDPFEREEEAADLMMGLDQDTRDAITGLYGTLSEMRQAHSAGVIDRTAFAMRAEQAYKEAAAVRPGYRDEYRQMTNSFLGKNFEANLSATWFGLNKDPSSAGKDLRTPDEKARDKLWEDGLTYMINNYGSSPGAVNMYRAMPKDQLISVAGQFKTNEAELVRRKEQLALLSDETEHYSSQVENYSQALLGQYFDTNITGMSYISLVNNPSAPDPFEQPDEYGQWLQVNAGELTGQLEAIISDPSQVVNKIYTDLDITDFSKVNASVTRNLEEQVKARATDTLELIRDPAYVAAMQRITEGMDDGEVMALLGVESYRKFVAAFPRGSDSFIAVMAGIEAGNTAIIEAVIPLLKGTISSDEAISKLKARLDAMLAKNKQGALALGDPEETLDLGADAEQAVREGLAGSLPDAELNNAAQNAAGLGAESQINGLIKVEVTDDNREALGRGLLRGEETLFDNVYGD